MARVVGGGVGGRQTMLGAVVTEISGYDPGKELAENNARADGQSLLRLVPCPRCGKRDAREMARFERITLILRVAVALAFLAIGVSIFRAVPDNPALPVICAVMPGAIVVWLIGYVRQLRAEVPKDRVTFVPVDESPPRRRKRKRRQG